MDLCAEAEELSRYQAYSEYDDSGVDWLGYLPKGWSCLPIKHFADVINGATPKSSVDEYWEGEHIWVTPADLSRLNSKNIQSSGRTITSAGLNSCGTSLVAAKSIVLSTRAPIGSLGIAGIELCTNQGCKSLVLNDPDSCEFVHYCLSIASESLNVLGKGTTFLELSSDELASFRLPMPSVEERAAITAFLDYETARIDGLIEKQQRLIELLKEKRQAVISHAVTKGLNPDAPMKDSGVEWLGQVPEHWIVCRLKQALSQPMMYGANEAALHNDPDEPRFIRITDMKADGALKEETFKSLPIDVAAPYLLMDGDLLFARSGATVGKSFLYQTHHGRACFAGYLIRASLNQKVALPEFVHLYAQSGPYWEFISGCQIQATIQNVSAEKYGNCFLALPCVEEQKEIVAVTQKKLAMFTEMEGAANKAIDLMMERRTALISAAVTGKIDLRGWKAPDAA